MTFQPVNELEQLLMAASHNPAQRPAFYRALTEHDLFVVTEASDLPESEQIVDHDADVQVRMVEMDGKPHTALFTSAERIQAIADEAAAFLSSNGRVLLESLNCGDFAINPGSKYGLILTAGEAKAVLDGSMFKPAQPSRMDVGGKDIMLGQPAVYPHQLTETLSKVFAKVQGVQAAYLAQAMIRDVDKASHLLIGIEAEGDWGRVMKMLGPMLSKVLPPDECIDFIQLTPGDKSGMACTLRKIKPFYKRKKKLLGLF